jgi:hypothetical protein
MSEQLKTAKILTIKEIRKRDRIFHWNRANYEITYVCEGLIYQTESYTRSYIEQAVIYDMKRRYHSHLILQLEDHFEDVIGKVVTADLRTEAPKP